MTQTHNGITAPFYLRDGVPGGLGGTAPVLNDSFGAAAVTYFELSVQRELPAHLSRRPPGANLPSKRIRPELLGPSAAQKDRSRVHRHYPDQLHQRVLSSAAPARRVQLGLRMVF